MIVNDLSYQQPGVHSRAWLPFLLTTMTSIALNIILHANVRTALVNQYPNDSFYTLSTSDATGLALIAFTLILLVLLAAWRATIAWLKRASKRSIGHQILLFGISLGVITAVYFLMLMIAPQVFYTYYQSVFIGLPIQWVIKPLASEALIQLLKLQAGASMGDHLAGFTWWVLMFNTVMQWARFCMYNRAD